MNEQVQAKAWYQQGAVLLSVIAIALAGYLLIRDEQEATRSKREEFRKLVIALHEGETRKQDGGSSGAAVSWVHFAAARRLEKEIPSQVTGVEYLILANFALDHGDFPTADEFIEKAKRQVQLLQNDTVDALAYVALGHIHFEHYPETDVEKGREYYRTAVKEAEEIGEKNFYSLADVHREWGLDEYSIGNLKEGDAQIEKAREILAAQSLPKVYMKRWDQDLEAATITAKVQGGLL